MSHCRLFKDSVHIIFKGFQLSYIARGKDRLLESWQDEFISHFEMFPVLEDRNSWYKCPEFVDMILTEQHLFCLQNWHLLSSLEVEDFLISQGDGQACAERWQASFTVQYNYWLHLGFCLKVER